MGLGNGMHDLSHNENQECTAKQASRIALKPMYATFGFVKPVRIIC